MGTVNGRGDGDGAIINARSIRKSTMKLSARWWPVYHRPIVIRQMDSADTIVTQKRLFPSVTRCVLIRTCNCNLKLNLKVNNGLFS